MDIQNILYASLRGFLDSFRGMLRIFYIDKEIRERQQNNRSPNRATVRQRHVAGSRETTPQPQAISERESPIVRKVLQCAVLNGGIFLCSILLFDYVVLPLLNIVFSKIFGPESFVVTFLWYWVEWALKCFFHTTWVFPIFVISKIVNTFWFLDIADSAYRHNRGRPVVFSSISVFVADSIFSLVIQFLFLLQAIAVSYIPIYCLGYALYMLQISILYALYAFEYKWYNLGWELHTRLAFVETNWPYFVGFGLPLAMVTQVSDSWNISGCIFSILFPFFIISANEATPVTGKSNYALHLFSAVVTVSNTIFIKTIGESRRQVNQSTN